MNAIRTPDWVKDAIFYQIFPDRFAISDAMPKPPNLEPWDSPPTKYGFKGGDLLGIVERLDYIQDLGINAIYLNPVFKSTANHRYHTYDYYQVDPILRGNDALRRLLDEAHGREIRVILDGVFNHVGRGFFQFNHILENSSHSPFIDWFIIKGFPLNAYDEDEPPNYEAWWNLHALPKLNVRRASVREFLLDVATNWIAFGIDGWRLDVPEEIDDIPFWQEFRLRVKSRNPNAYIVGEIWHEAKGWLRGDRFDGVMNYLLNKACIGFFIEKKVDEDLVKGMGYAPVPHIDAKQFADTIDFLLNLYDHEVNLSLLNLLDSHDTARFLTLARGDQTALRMAMLFLMTYPGAPCVYYGDEIGLEGGRDPDCRRAFPWDERKWNTELRNYIKKCIALRHDHITLRRGEFKTLFAKDEVYVYFRRLEHETMIVTFNVSRDVRSLQIGSQDILKEGFFIREIWSNSALNVKNGVLEGFTLQPRSGGVWIVENAQKK